MKKIGVQGLRGKTGRFLIPVLAVEQDVSLYAIVRNKSEPILFPNGNEVTQITFNELSKDATKLDIIIDFSSPEGSLSAAQFCHESKTPLLIATTGFSDKEMEVLKELSKDSFPLLFAPNTSMGVITLLELSKLAKSILKEGYDVSISEIHHNQKKDAPSGTAKLIRDVAQVPDENIISIRGGSVVGEHTIYFIGQGERLELTHKAWDRSIFARGAVSLGLHLIGRKPGFYIVNRDFLENK